MAAPSMKDSTDSNPNLSQSHSQAPFVLYFASTDYIRTVDKFTKTKHRLCLLHSLIEANELQPHLTIVTPKPATREEIETFHSSDYVECVQRISAGEDKEESFTPEDLDDFGVGYDCPVVEGTYDFASLSAGASLQAADALASRKSRVAINWGGGWHHAKKDQAAGFCYFNDAVLAILRLRKTFPRVLYVDIDVHHGDGVDEAFAYTNRVLTVSFHRHSPGFYPGTGKLTDTGCGKGKYHSVNVPLEEGIRDDQYVRIFREVMSRVVTAFRPDAVVMQCGADCLTGDPLGGFNLTLEAPSQCVKMILDWELPTLLLGGGGYEAANTARLWAKLTGVAVNRDLPDDIPDSCIHFTRFGPDYQLCLGERTGPNRNSAELEERVVRTVLQNLDVVERCREAL